MNIKKNEHVIKEVFPGSIAEEMEIEPGDVLLAINGQDVEDVFDYRYMIKDEYIEVLVRKPDGEEWLLEIEKEYDDDLGIEFENSLMSEYRSCSNKCIFCFIDQMPPGMRDTLYFKDDDSRLSFLQGNYITLTNMKDRDIERIIRNAMKEFNIDLSDEQVQELIKLMNKISKLDLDVDALAKQAGELYEKLKGMGLDLDNIDTEKVGNFITRFFDSIVSFFSNLFS